MRVIIDSQVKQIKQLEDKVKQLEEHRQALIEDKVQLQMELSDLKER